MVESRIESIIFFKGLQRAIPLRFRNGFSTLLTPLREQHASELGFKQSRRLSEN
jgi:hypothetical protein